MANGNCDIEGCKERKIAHVRFDDPKTKQVVMDLDLCYTHGEAMRKTYFPKAPPLVKNPCAEIPIAFEVAGQK